VFLKTASTNKRNGMAKKIKTVIKLQIKAGQANPAPPVGPALGQHGLNIQEFCSSFNDKTRDKMGDIVPVEITVYDDRTFSFIMKTAPASALIMKVLGLKKGSNNALTSKVGTLTQDQLREIAIQKMPDLNTKDVEAAMKIIAGSARQMGVEIK
jgi:large subunit ribosomal protein L11